MKADKSKFKEQRRPDSLSGTATGSLRERVNHPVSAASQPCPGALLASAMVFQEKLSGRRSG